MREVKDSENKTLLATSREAFSTSSKSGLDQTTCKCEVPSHPAVETKTDTLGFNKCPCWADYKELKKTASKNTSSKAFLPEREAHEGGSLFSDRDHVSSGALSQVQQLHFAQPLLFSPRPQPSSAPPVQAESLLAAPKRAPALRGGLRQKQPQQMLGTCNPFVTVCHTTLPVGHTSGAQELLLGKL